MGPAAESGRLNPTANTVLTQVPCVSTVAFGTLQDSHRTISSGTASAGPRASLNLQGNRAELSLDPQAQCGQLSWWPHQCCGL